jgi:hypothetical protein
MRLGGLVMRLGGLVMRFQGLGFIQGVWGLGFYGLGFRVHDVRFGR